MKKICGGGVFDLASPALLLLAGCDLLLSLYQCQVHVKYAWFYNT